MKETITFKESVVGVSREETCSLEFNTVEEYVSLKKAQQQLNIIKKEDGVEPFIISNGTLN